MYCICLITHHNPLTYCHTLSTSLASTVTRPPSVTTTAHTDDACARNRASTAHAADEEAEDAAEDEAEDDDEAAT